MFQPKLIDFGWTELEKGSLIKYKPNKSLNLSRIDERARQTRSVPNAAYYNKRMSKIRTLGNQPLAERYDSLYDRASTLNIPRRMLEKHKAIQQGIEIFKKYRKARSAPISSSNFNKRRSQPRPSSAERIDRTGNVANEVLASRRRHRARKKIHSQPDPSRFVPDPSRGEV